MKVALVSEELWIEIMLPWLSRIFYGVSGATSMSLKINFCGILKPPILVRGHGENCLNSSLSKAFHEMHHCFLF